jgi:hypothetical protein
VEGQYGDGETHKESRGKYDMKTKTGMFLALFLTAAFSSAGIAAVNGSASLKSTQATCSADSSALIYLLQGRSFWRTPVPSGWPDLIGDSLCSLRPRKISSIVGDTFIESKMAFLSQSDSLFIFKMSTFYATCVCCRSSSSCFWHAIQFLQPFPPQTCFELIVHNRFDTNTIAMILNSRPYFITVSFTGDQTGIDSFPPLVNSAGRTVLFLGREPGSNGNGDKGLWITGSKGMIRYLSLSTQDYGAESVFDIDTTEDVTCYGDGCAGTMSGSVYQRLTGAAPDSSFRLVTKASLHRLRMISRAGAAGDSGTFYDNTYGSWEYHKLDAFQYVHFAIGPLVDGAGVELVDDQWKRHFYIYKNTPSFISKTAPPGLKETAKTPVVYTGDTTLSFSICIDDSERNYDVPTVIISSQSGATETLIDSTVAGRSSPIASRCISNNLTQFDSIGFSFALMTDSVVVRNSIRRTWTTIGGDCYYTICMSTAQPFVVSRAWAKGDTLRLSEGHDTLRFVYADNTGLAAFGSRISSSKPTVRCCCTGKTVSFRISGLAPGKTTTLSVYDVTGRRIWFVPHVIETVCTMPRPKAAGVAFVVLKRGAIIVFQRMVPFLQSPR